MPATQLQFLGHASFRIVTPEGRTVLIDPWMTGNPALPTQLLPLDAADLILVTHGHDDHFDSQLPALLARTGAVCIAQPQVRFYLYDQGVPTTQFEALNKGGSVEVLGVRVTMTLAFHAAHIDLPDGGTAHPHEAVGFVLRFSDGAVVYAAGDTALFGDMHLLAELYQPKVALLPIGDRYTMGPLEAAHATRLLQVRHVVPFHYGTFPALTGTPAQLQEQLSTLGHAAEVHALQPGDTLDLATLD